MSVKQTLKSMPVLGPALAPLYLAAQRRRFAGSAGYWNTRYVRGGNSGAGSYNKLARFKADVINRFVRDHQVDSVFEFGCGDGNQLEMMDYPSYVGYDISPLVLENCRRKFAQDESLSFRLVDEYKGESADLTLSLDVIYHLVEDEVFREHMKTLFGASSRYVGIYSSDINEQEALQPPHVRHRKFTSWVALHVPDFRLIEHIPNLFPYNGNADQTSFSDFYFFEKADRPVLRTPTRENP